VAPNVTILLEEPIPAVRSYMNIKLNNPYSRTIQQGEDFHILVHLFSKLFARRA